MDTWHFDIDTPWGYIERGRQERAAAWQPEKKASRGITLPRMHCMWLRGVKENMLLRLRRVEGQVRGIQKMVEEERYCPDVLTQMSAIHESLRSVERILMKNHLQHCATEALRSGDEIKAQKTYDELTELFYRHAR